MLFTFKKKDDKLHTEYVIHL